jgi:hypothetical protein
MRLSRPESEELFVEMLLDKVASLADGEYYDEEDYYEDYEDDAPRSVIDFLYR